MLTLISLAVLGGVLAYYFTQRDSNRIEGDLECFTCIGIGVGLVIGGVVALGVGFAADSKAEKEWVITSRSELVAMGDISSSGGSFFIGCGTIKGTPYYVYYEKRPDGGYHFNKVQADLDSVIVYQDRNEGGELLVKREQSTETFWWARWFGFSFSVSPPDLHEFHIPEGSLKQEFKLDLE